MRIGATLLLLLTRAQAQVAPQLGCTDWCRRCASQTCSPPPPLPPEPPPSLPMPHPPSPPPLDCNRIVPLGSGHSSGAVCEGCWTYAYRCRSHNVSTSGLAGCSGTAFNSHPFPKCHWIGEHCSSSPGVSLYGRLPSHCPRSPSPVPDSELRREVTQLRRPVPKRPPRRLLSKIRAETDRP